MRLIINTTLAVVMGLAVAHASPPSSTLSGEDGTLSWTITATENGFTIVGTSPKWTVTHHANKDLTPIRTERVEPDGRTVITQYSKDQAVITLPNRTITQKEANLWDGDTLDIRLGHLVAKGTTEIRFRAVDPSSGKVYGFQGTVQGQEQCGTQSCTHMLVQLTGVLKLVGPSFYYWFASTGQLLHFEGPAGDFYAEGAR